MPSSQIRRDRAASPSFGPRLIPFRIVNILQIVIYLTTILTTINRQQKIVPTSKNLQKVRHPASIDLRRHFRIPLFDLPTGRRSNFSLSSMAGNRACRLTYHMFENYEPRTHRDRFVTLAFIHRSHNKMPFDFFFFSVSLSPFVCFLSLIRFLTFFPLSLSFSRSLFQNSARKYTFHTFHTTSYSSHERRSKGLHGIYFIMISHIVTDFCSICVEFLIDARKNFSSKNCVSNATFATKWKIIDNT